MIDEIVKEYDNRTIFKIIVIAGSNDFEIVEIDKWRNSLKIKVNAKPLQGKANKLLVEKLSKILNAKVEIISGKKSREKILLVNRDKPCLVKRLKEIIKA